MNNYLLNYNDLIEVYDDDLYATLENISYSTDSLGNKVEICRCKKFLKQDPQFIVFKVSVKMDGDHYYMLPGSIDLFKSVFPNGEVGDPFLTNFNKVDMEKFLNSLNDTTINNESEVVSRLVDKFKMTEDKAKEIYHGYCGDKEFSKEVNKINNNFSERLSKSFGLTRKSSSKISDIYEVNNGKIICDNQNEVREVVDKMVELNDWSIEIICNFEDSSHMFEGTDFKDLSKLKIDTSNVTDMQNMFDGCKLLISIPKLDTSNVTNMYGIFWNCTSLTLIPKLDTSKVTNMNYMFNGCESLTTIPELDTSNVTRMFGMFKGCASLITIPQLDTSKVTDIRYMFEECESLRKLGYPINDNKKIKEIISTTGIDGKPYKSELPQITPEKVISGRYDFSERLRKCNFAYSNMTSRVLKIKFDPSVLRLNNLNRFLDTFKMLPIVSEVKKEDDTIILLINTDESQVGVSEIINSALAKVASNVTYQIVEE